MQTGQRFLPWLKKERSYVIKSLIEKNGCIRDRCARCNGPFVRIFARARLGETRMGNGSMCTSIMASVWQAGQRVRQSAELGQWNSPRERREELVKKEKERERKKESTRWVIPTSRQRLLRFRNKTRTATFFFTPTRPAYSRLVFTVRPPPPGIRRT